MNDIERILSEAHRLIKLGWCQHVGEMTTVSGEHQVCAGFALIQGTKNVTGEISTYVTDMHIRAAETFMEAIKERYLDLPEDRVYDIPWWNDRPERTKEEVLDTFDHAIKLAQRDGP